MYSKNNEKERNHDYVRRKVHSHTRKLKSNNPVPRRDRRRTVPDTVTKIKYYIIKDGK